jgi:hypothetical protein
VRACEHEVSLFLALGRGRAGRLGRALGGFDLRFCSQPGTIEGRLRLQALTVEQPLRCLLYFAGRTLASLQPFLELAGLLARAALTKPLTHYLQVAVDLGWVIATPDKPEVTLNNVDRTRLTLIPRSHRPVRSPVPARLLQRSPRDSSAPAPILPGAGRTTRRLMPR